MPKPWYLVAVFILAHVFTLHSYGQSITQRQRNWGLHIGGSLMWNTVHGDRYNAYRPNQQSIPLRNISYINTRSFERNSASWAVGVCVERHLYKFIWISLGVELVQRKHTFVFDPDTLMAYPPVLPPPNGLFY